HKVAERLPRDISEASGKVEIDRRLLLGEFLRQLARFHEAEQAFLSVLEKTDPYSRQGLIARYELFLIKSNNTRIGYLQSEAVKMFEKDPDYIRASRIPTVSDQSRLREQLVSEPSSLGSAWKFLKRLVWSSDGSTIFSSTGNGVVAIELSSGKSSESEPLSDSRDRVGNGYEIQLSTRGALFVTQMRPPSLRKLDTKSLEATAFYDVQDLLPPVLLSVDGKSLIYDVGSGVQLRNLETNETTSLGLPLGMARNALDSWYLKAVDPSGHRLVIYSHPRANQPSIVVWDYVNNTKFLELPADQWAQLAPTAQVAFSPNSQRLYVATDVIADPRTDGKQRCDQSIWEMPSGKLISRRIMEGDNSRLSVSSDGRYVAMSCGQSISLWSSDLATLTATLKIRGYGWFPSIAFDPKSEHFAVHTGAAVVIYKIGN
ncbi:WD40 repeat domain-containing protein, partial [Herbaspirillum huttiense]|uniref:WD40 repeat domain-containing protein n=1 Tax=Herbaspirillum huttiense TaxID=863372 RepID=UPI003B3B112C